MKDVLPPTVAEALRAGNKIEAIKRLRGITGLGLKEAKDWVESFERGGAAPIAMHATRGGLAAAHKLALLRASRRGLSPGQVAPGGGMGKWMVLFAFAVIAIVVALYT